MKILVLLVLLISTVILAQPQTFRSMSTGGMILDDLDRWFSGMLFLQPVPDRLLDIEGIRVYSGLSNLSTGTDMIFKEAESTRGGFLLGGSYAPVEGNFGLGILTEFMNDRFYGDISLIGPGGTPYITGRGFVEGTWSEYQDTNGDGTLDSRHTVHETGVARTDSSFSSEGVYGAYSANETLRFGLGVSYVSSSAEALNHNHNYSISVTDSNLVTGAETYTMNTAGEGYYRNDLHGIEVSASVTGAATDMMDVGGMFMYTSLSAEVSQSADRTGSKNYLPGQSGVYDYTSWNGSDNFSVSPAGNRFGGGLNMGLKLDESWTVDISGGYYTLSMTGSSDHYSTSMDSSYIVTVGSFIDSTIIDMDGSGGTDNEFNNDRIAAGAKLTFDPSEKFTISMGAGFFMHDNTNTVSNTSSNTVVKTHSDGDEEFADPDDYVSTSTWTQTEETSTTLSTRRISIPIGLEFEVLPKLCARLGASPGFVWEKETETNTLTDASPVTTHIVHGDGSEEQLVENPYSTVDGTLVETDETFTDIPFSYGVGYTPNDYIQIDLMGLGNNFDQWRLSATLSF